MSIINNINPTTFQVNLSGCIIMFFSIHSIKSIHHFMYRVIYKYEYNKCVNQVETVENGQKQYYILRY